MMSKRTLQDLEGKRLGKYTLQLTNVSAGRFKEERRFDIYLEKAGKRSHAPLVRGTYFSGSGYYAPWMEIYYERRTSIPPQE